MSMRDVKLEKVVLNMGIRPDDKTENASKIIEEVSGVKPVVTRSKKRSTFNVPKGRALGCMVTIRKNAPELLKKLLEAKENKLQKRNFDNTGNLSFGIEEYINVPGMKYDPNVGMLGFDVCVTLTRPGYRVKKRKIKSKVGKKHLITKNDAIEFMQKEFNVEVSDNAQ